MFAAFVRARIRVARFTGCLGLALMTPVWAAGSIDSLEATLNLCGVSA